MDKIDSVHNRRRILKLGSVAVALSLAGCVGDDDDDDTDADGADDDADDADDDNGVGGQTISWHAGGEGGTYFPLSVEFKGIVEDNTDHTLQVQSTGASVENVGSLGREEADFALIQNDIAFFAREGTGLDVFEGDPIENLEGVATLYPETIHIITRPGADIDSIADLEGMRVNTGDLGSGTQVNALQILESVAGLTTEDFDEQNTAFGPAADQIRDGDVDAAFVVGGWPVGAVEDLATTTDIGLLSLTDDERETARADAAWFADDTIPAGTYAGIDEDVDTVSVQAMIATHSGLSADLVEEITRTLFDNVDQLTIKTAFIGRETALDGMSIDLHEGASRVLE